MVSPNPNGGTGAGGAAPPTVYDPYMMLIQNLPLPADVFSLLAPTFDQLGSKLELDGASVLDLRKNVLPHYRVVTKNGKIVLLHIRGEDTPNLLAIAFTFLSQSIGLFVFTEVDTLTFDPDEMISMWRMSRPKLRARFITQPTVQQLELESDTSRRTQIITDLLSLDELLAVSNLSLDEQLEQAYKKGRLDLLDEIPGLPERFTETDRTFLSRLMMELADSTEDYVKYLRDLIRKLDLEPPELFSEITGALNGNSRARAESLLWWLGEMTYPEPKYGYHRVLGYLLSILADESGSGQEIARIIFKYKLVSDESALKTLITKFP